MCIHYLQMKNMVSALHSSRIYGEQSTFETVVSALGGVLLSTYGYEIWKGLKKEG